MSDQVPQFEGSQDVGNFPIQIKGGTDGTIIGNVGDRLKTDTIVVFNTGQVLSWSKKIRWIDMNASNGGIARDTSVTNVFTNIFSYTGSGYFIGFNLTLEDKLKWYLSLEADNEKLFDTNGIYTADMANKLIYGWETADVSDERNIGLSFRDETVSFQSPLYGIRFESSLTLKVRHENGGKKFRAGIVCIQKDT